MEETSHSAPAMTPVQATVQAMIEELSVVPVIGPEAGPPRTLTIPDSSLLSAWMELFSIALDHSNFLEWINPYDFELESLLIKGDTLHVSTSTAGVREVRVFTLQDNSGWWKVAPPILAIARNIDPAGIGLRYADVTSTDQGDIFPRQIVLSFYGYPEPENPMQARIIVDELKTTGLASIGDNARTTSAIVDERSAQIQDYGDISTAITLFINTCKQQKQTYNRARLGLTRLQLCSGSYLAKNMALGADALGKLIRNEQFIALADLTAPVSTCSYSFQLQTFLFIHTDGSNTEKPYSVFADSLAQVELAQLTQIAERIGTAVYSTQYFSLDQLAERYGLQLPATLPEAETLATQLLHHTWAPLPYVSEYIQSRNTLRGYLRDFADSEELRHIIRRLEAISIPMDDADPIVLSELSHPLQSSSLAERIEKETHELLAFRSIPAFQDLLERNGLSARSSLWLSANGRVNADDLESTSVDLTRQIENNSALKAQRDRLVHLAQAADGIIRTSGAVTLRQLLLFYVIPLPITAGDAYLTAQWLKPFQRLQPSFQDHWYLLGRHGEGSQKITDDNRQAIISTTAAFLPQDSLTLIDYLSEGLMPDLDHAALRVKADVLMSQVLISPRACELGTRLLQQLAPMGWKDMELVAANRERLVATAIILSLDPSAGKRPESVVDHPLTDHFFWGESYREVRRSIDHLFGFQSVKNKTLATHILLSGIAPEFMVRDIPDSLAYMSSSDWVQFKQMVFYIESSAPGLARMMDYSELKTLIELPGTPAVRRSHARDTSASCPVDWGIARGVIANEPRPYSNATLSSANTAYVAHNRQMSSQLLDAFNVSFPTPYTVALEALRNVLPDSPHLEDKVLELSSVTHSVLQRKYSLVELHVENRLANYANIWSTPVEEVQRSFTQAGPSLSHLAPISKQFLVLLGRRLRAIKVAYIAMIKESLCKLPLQQRVDLESGQIELFTLHPETNDATPPSAGRFAIILSSQGSFSRVYEVFVRGMNVVLRRDIHYSMLTASSTGATAGVLPFDEQAYLHGTVPNPANTCRGTLKRLVIEGGPLVATDFEAVPATFTSDTAGAIAITAVKQLFDEYEATALRLASTSFDAEVIDGNHEQWLAFFVSLSPLDAKISSFNQMSQR